MSSLIINKENSLEQIHELSHFSLKLFRILSNWSLTHSICTKNSSFRITFSNEFLINDLVNTIILHFSHSI